MWFSNVDRDGIQQVWKDIGHYGNADCHLRAVDRNTDAIPFGDIAGNGDAGDYRGAGNADRCPGCNNHSEVH